MVLLPGVVVLAVAVTAWINVPEMLEIGSDPDAANVWFVPTFQDIGVAMSGLSNAICNGTAGRRETMGGNANIFLMTSNFCQRNFGYEKSQFDLKKIILSILHLHKRNIVRL